MPNDRPTIADLRAARIDRIFADRRLDVAAAVPSTGAIGAVIAALIFGGRYLMKVLSPEAEAVDWYGVFMSTVVLGIGIQIWRDDIKRRRAWRRRRQAPAPVASREEDDDGGPGSG